MPESTEADVPSGRGARIQRRRTLVQRRRLSGIIRTKDDTRNNRVIEGGRETLPVVTETRGMASACLWGDGMEMRRELATPGTELAAQILRESIEVFEREHPEIVEAMKVMG